MKKWPKTIQKEASGSFVNVTHAGFSILKFSSKFQSWFFFLAFLRFTKFVDHSFEKLTCFILFGQKIYFESEFSKSIVVELDEFVQNTDFFRFIVFRVWSDAVVLSGLRHDSANRGGLPVQSVQLSLLPLHLSYCQESWKFIIIFIFLRKFDKFRY